MDQQTIYPTSLVVTPEALRYEIENLARMFAPVGIRISQEPEQNEIFAALEPTEQGCRLAVRVALGAQHKELEQLLPKQPEPQQRDFLAGRMLYRLLSEMTGLTLPWGILTGVRPVKLCHQLAAQGVPDQEIAREMTERYLVSPEKASLAAAVRQAEEPVIREGGAKTFSLYISIPFCPSRCSYCSFVSHDIEKTFKLVPDYVRLLCQEIAYTGQVAKSLGLTLQTVYMGGGTPTSLSAAQLREIMEAVEQSFDFSGLLEYTVEAGRPDTITREKLETIRDMGVKRISINPQTMNDSVLEAIGRRHTADQVEQSLALARQVGFACVNMDTIAGLPTDTQEGFRHTMDRIIRLRPENVTVHTLTVKRSSALREEEHSQIARPGAMVDYARKALSSAGYLPYYLYRQKATIESLENTGYCLPGHEGRYNICIMNETQTILAVGAGASTKLYFPETGELERVFNYKFPYEYIGRFEEILARKERVMELYARHT
ncbi:coproporphyrinogen dehydrogenase HemZ [Oscillospiraceae bacterium MB08-C2-2]|nr:coproporphyrinogen dehydrogenase HemZ [Oscillospiraceae bacterium MB08-C2-2]